MATPPEMYPEPDITSPEPPGDITSPVVVGPVLAQYWGQETQGPQGLSSGPWPPSQLRACCPLPPPHVWWVIHLYSLKPPICPQCKPVPPE